MSIWDTIKEGASGTLGFVANPIQYGLAQAGLGADKGLQAMAPGLHKKLFGKNSTPTDNFEKNAALQREFAQNGIRWKVNDAKMAGIHPLYALGAQGASFSPMYSSDSGDQGDVDTAALADIGQGVTRAVSQTRTQEERMSAMLQLRGMDLDNQIKQAELQRLQGGTPAFPSTSQGSQSFIEGQVNSGPNKIINKPMERVTSYPGRPDIEPGSKTGVGFYNTASGALVPVPSVDTKQSIEDNLIQELMWSARNNVLPNITGGSPPPGYRWSVKEQAYVPETGADPKDWKDTKPYSREGKEFPINRRFYKRYPKRGGN